MPAWYLKDLKNSFCKYIVLAGLIAVISQSVILSSSAAESGLIRSSSGSALGSASKIQGESLLPAEQAFSLLVKQITGNQFLLEWTIEDGYYLYRDKLVLDTPEEKVVIADLPEGEMTVDDYFGEVEIYRNSLSIGVSGRNLDKTVSLSIHFQGCAENRYCYPTSTITVDLPFSL